MTGAQRNSQRLSRLQALILLWLLGSACSGVAVTLEGIRVHQAPDHVRVVLDTSATVTYNMFTLDNPHRVVIDLSDTRVAPAFSSRRPKLSRTAIKAFRTSVRNGKDYRIVLDVAQAVKPNGFTLKPVQPYGHRLVIDLYGSLAAQLPASVPSQDQKLRDVIVAIDAGHGGEDPGTIGVGGVYEKKVVLGIAKDLKRLLDTEPGFHGFLVRQSDYYVPHRERIHLSRQNRADVFISVHADSFKSAKVRGASVYALSDKGASSETARWFAEKENASDLIGGVGDVKLADKDDLLAHVLLDLSMDASRSASIAVGESVLKSMSGVTRLHKKQVEQAGFLVLKAPDVPSILIETGYLSNPEEAKNLARRSHQNTLAQAIFRGVTSYLRSNPPPSSLLAYQKNNRSEKVKHVIRRGDTLSEIAARYHVSPRRLREINGLAGDVIRIGQVLVIPAG